MSPRNVEKDQQMREKRLAHILESAIEIMAVKGIGSVSIGDIAAAAGVSVGNVYHYFKSKDEIFAELLKRGQTGYGAFVTEVAGRELPAADKLRAISEAWLALGNSWAYTLLIHTARMSETSTDQLRREVTGRFTANLGPVAEIVSQGQREGSVVPGEPTELALYFVSLIQGLTLQRAPGVEVPVGIRAEGVVRLFLADGAARDA
ncbi:TetR/AcrR family transcriptional regulator [Cohnella sp. GCM10020058]|uniref:TetR/AcrR family transcriptional regulator n=1 Tax=Cohnella sp. GCM10020058 TaxID=3317330 RepID=UPI0036361B9B